MSPSAVAALSKTWDLPTNWLAEAIADGPTHAYLLDEPSGTTVTDLITSGAVNGTYANSPTLAQAAALPSRAGSSVSFDGSNDYASFAIDFSAYTVLTIELFLKKTSYANGDALLGEYTANYNTGSSGGFILDIDSASGFFDVGVRNTGNGVNIVYFGRPPTSGFHHLVIQLKPTTLDFRVWIDGEPSPIKGVGSSSSTAGNFANSTFYLMSRNGASLFNAGILDNLVFYNKVLTTKRVIAHYNAAVRDGLA